MKLLDKKFRINYKRYLFQCSIATLATFLILLLIDKASNLIILASFGASAFIVFTMPHASAAKPRCLLGGYATGSIVGIVFYYINLLISNNLLLQSSNIYLILSSALCVGITSLVMVITDTEHPPAVGMALGLVINDWSYLSLVITLLAIVSLSAVRKLLKPYLINLK